jgi:hypothetical protein
VWSPSSPSRAGDWRCGWEEVEEDAKVWPNFNVGGRSEHHPRQAIKVKY